jgi:hypothetical protein
MTIKGEIEEEKKDEEVELTVETKGEEEWLSSSLSVLETQLEDHNDVQGENQRDRAEWGTARFVGAVTWSSCTFLSIAGVLLVLFPIGLFAFFCPCDKKNVYRVDGKYYDENDNYLGEGNKVEGIRRRSFRPTGVRFVSRQEEEAMEKLREIESELEEANSMLKLAQEKEEVLGMRSSQYRKELDEQARLLHNEQIRLHLNLGQRQEETDKEHTPTAEEMSMEQHMEKWEKDEDALAKVVAAHEDILVHCETIRRKIRQLEAKRTIQELEVKRKQGSFRQLSGHTQRSWYRA